MRTPDEIAEALIVGDASAVDEAIAYLERDPWEFRSGYAKATLMRRLKHVSLADEHLARLEHVLLRYVDVGLRWDFREACVLARRIDAHRRCGTLRAALRQRLHGSNMNIALRGLTMLTSLRRPRLSAAERTAGRTLLLRWASERDHSGHLRPSQSIEKAVRRLWSAEWARQLHDHANATASDPLRSAARKLLKVAPRSARR